MIIGVKFCGGCNPGYDRKDLLNRIMKKNAGHRFEYAHEETIYDILLVICGCSRCCADYSRFSYDRIVIVSTADDVPELAPQI